ncbi:MAG: hypothetical protein JWO83_3958 [Caulobacteraceae bacterium]|nr:hypothetical protein [Caulobacteraceae bacterium]
MVAAAALLGLVATSPAQALSIIPVYDSSITSRPNAAAIEAAFGAVATEFGKAYARNVTVKIGVSWGKVNGVFLPPGNIASSRMSLLTGFTYADMTDLFGADAAANPSDTNMATVAAHLPKASPAGSLGFAIPYAEAQAVGYLPATIGGNSGYVGFSSSAAWDFDPANGISAGSYDFEGLAAHEVSEVLGRITGLCGASPTYATPIDVLRYSAPGVSSFSYASSAYFSINGGVTNLGTFNASGGGDRTDWRSVVGDAQNAYLSTGVNYALTTADKTMLDVLGWGVAAPTVTIGSATPGDGLIGAGDGLAVPEPKTWILMLCGIGLAGGARRRAAARLRRRARA